MKIKNAQGLTEFDDIVREKNEKQNLHYSVEGFVESFEKMCFSKNESFLSCFGFQNACQNLGRFFLVSPDHEDDDLILKLSLIAESKGEDVLSAREAITEEINKGKERGAFSADEIPPYFISKEDNKEANAVDIPENVIPQCPIVFHPLAEAVIQDVAESGNTCREMSVAALLMLVSAGISAKRRAYLHNGYDQPSNLFALVEMETGGRKSYPMNVVFKRLRAEDKRMRKKYRDFRREWEKNVRLSKKRDSNVEHPGEQPPKEVKIITDATVESTISIAADNPEGLFFLYDEAKNFTHQLDKYSSKDGGSADKLMIAGYNVIPYASDRKNKDGESRDTDVDNLALTFFGNIQPRAIPTTFSDGPNSQGLIERFIFFRGYKLREYKKSRPIEPFTEKFIENVTKYVFYSWKKSESEKHVPESTYLSDEALELFYEYEREVHEAEYPSYLRGMMEKTTGRNLRLALVIHIVDNICKFIKCEEIVNKMSLKQIDALGDGENRETEQAYAYFTIHKERPDFNFDNNKITFDQMERAIALTRYLNEVAAQVYSEHFAMNFSASKTEFVLQSDEQRRIHIVRKFIEKNLSMAMESHTIKELEEAGMSTSLWNGDIRKISGWFKKHGLVPKNTKKGNGWFLADIKLPSDG